MIRTETVIHKKESELKKAEKLLKQSKKMILMRYKNQSIYQLYNRESDSIIISESIDFNEDLLTDENTENNEITNQSFIFKIKLFTEFFNEKIFDSSDSMSKSVRDKAKVKENAMKISSS